MKMAAIKAYFKKNRKKALVIYLCWSVVKGVLLLVFGVRLFS